MSVPPGPPAFDRYLGVDWSGAKGGGNVFVAEVVAARKGHRVERVERSSRAQVEAELAVPAARRTLVGLDFCFSFPASFAIGGRDDWTWTELGVWASSLVGPDAHADVSHALAQSRERSQFRLVAGDPAPALHRRTELACRPLPASVVHVLPYQRQVCLGSIHGIALLDRQRGRPGLSVWPFDDPTGADTVVAEVYPAMWVAPGVAKRRPSHRLRQVQEWRTRVGGIDDAIVDLVLDSEDAFDALAVAVALPDLVLSAPPDVDREGWILGVELPSP